uniref:DNA polymerase III subunit gamma/tau n=1 Tax=Cajanus cajan TaxID=3821 RepID=A0A151S6F0_CAJCA|nr:DNA polymerase III subunit gamma/tau [Cajanus cajan]
MTRAVRSRILKDANGDISDHLRNHIHLTNCIHLKNHMHKNSPILADRSIMRDLVVLQRSRSLRDPSASPPSWHSPSVVDLLFRRVENDAASQGGRKSVGVERRKEGRRNSGTSPPLVSIGSSRVAPGEVEPLNQAGKSLAEDVISRHSESKDRKSKQRGKNVRDVQVKTLSQQLNDVPLDSDDLASSNIHFRGRRKFRSTRRTRVATTSRDIGAENELSVASNSLAQASAHHKYHLEEAEEFADDNVTRAPKNGCGIPWNWSRIHHRGKTFLDMAGRSFSCGLSDSRGNRHGRHQSLTQKYMPRTFRDMVGQNLVAQALSNAVVKRKVGLLYVFYGPHGTGKTSCARIFARALNCNSSEHPKPCGFCNYCIAHDMGKSRNIREVGPVSNFDFEGIMDLLDNMVVSQLPSHYRVFIFDDCDTLSMDCWNAISKVIDRAPRRVVFILVSSSLDVLPHIIISRCQKFFFPKLKDADIIYTLQWIATKEGLEIEKDALKLIASRSDGSLRDAEMTLEQLSLLGQRISVPLVQELVGLISDEKLVDLLDLALSADTVNTVKNLRVIMETGVEPLALMSQLATVITDILAGTYDFTKERRRRKFFRRQPLSKEDMEKLRQALKTLSEAEKQLRMSNDKLTWLTAALLQLAPDQQYVLPTSSDNNGMTKGLGSEKKRHSVSGFTPQQAHLQAADKIRMSERQILGKNRRDIEEIWLEVLERIQVSGLKEFLFKEGKLISVSFGAAPTVQLMFSSQLTKSTAEKFRGHILQAFESVLGSSITIEIRCESSKDAGSAVQLPLNDSLSQIGDFNGVGTLAHPSLTGSVENRMGEIVEEATSQVEHKKNEQQVDACGTSYKSLEGTGVGQASTSQKKPIVKSHLDQRKLMEQGQSRSLVRSKVSLAHVIQQAEGQRSGWSKRKAVSIAEKLEQENLRLEPRSRSLLCWKASRVTRRKLSRLKIRTRKSRALLNLVSCGKCLSTKSPR